MAVSGFVLITVCLANVLTVRAECCKCDCQQSQSLLQPQLHYLPVSPPQIFSVGHGLTQGLTHATSQDAQSLYSYGYQATGSSSQYKAGESYGIGNSLEVGGSKLGSGGIALGLQKTPQITSFSAIGLGLHKAPQITSSSYKGQGELDLSSSLSGANLKQQQVSKVSTHQDNHYINIEQHASPHEGSSADVNSLEHEKGHDHGKNDYYKFEYKVNDQHTHDIKSHKEEKKGDVVQGEYSLLEDDGNVRTVKYYADWKTGFHAQVHNSKTNTLG